MSTGLFDSPPLPLDRSTGTVADSNGYRSLSGTAIAAACVAALSPLVFLGWSFLAVPIVGVVLAAVALGDVSRRPEAVTGRGLALAALAASLATLVAGGGFLAWDYAQELPPGFVRIHYGLLQPLPGDPPTAAPDAALELDGRDVLLKGYMYPGSRQQGITEFLLCRDQGDCCFGGDPKLTDRVLVRIADPRGIAFTQRLVTIAGRFRVEPAGTAELGGGVLYHLDEALTR
jgi:hypothetical protein